MKFPFELGADEDHAVAGLFGVWKRRTCMEGR
jgi:peroxiredoxin